MPALTRIILIWSWLFLNKCGFVESDQEGVVKSIQDFALDVYNNLCDEEKKIDAETVMI